MTTYEHTLKLRLSNNSLPDNKANQPEASNICSVFKINNTKISNMNQIIYKYIHYEKRWNHLKWLERAKKIIEKIREIVDGQIKKSKYKNNNWDK